MPVRTASTVWNRTDLLERVAKSLEMARCAVQTLAAASATSSRDERESAIHELVGNKVVAETAMLLVCAAPLRDLDRTVASRLDDLQSLLIPHARSSDVLSAICIDPGLALHHAAAHVLLTRLGSTDAKVDRLLAESLSLGADFGPERLAHQRLEQQWLRRMRGESPSATGERRDLADSMLGRPMDVLGATRFDMYAFTHAAMYASDVGERRFALPRSGASIVADADAATAHVLASNDLDLAAELTLTSPMLGRAWSPAATFAFRILTEAQDELGFLPGIHFHREHCDALTGDERSLYIVRTCYHATYVMGFLCAVAARSGFAPPTNVSPAQRSRGAGAAAAHLVADVWPASAWTRAFASLDPRQQDSLAVFGLTAVLQRAKATGDLRLIREALQVALTYDLIDAPAPRQATALLRRAQLLDPSQEP